MCARLDPAQSYRGIDIGTNKLTAQQQCNIPHHLIDVFDPFAPAPSTPPSYIPSAVRFAQQAKEVTEVWTQLRTNAFSSHFLVLPFF